MQKKSRSLETDILKEKYEQLEMEVIAFENEDVITASGDEYTDIELPALP